MNTHLMRRLMRSKCEGDDEVNAESLSKPHIFWTHLQTFIPDLPRSRRVMVEQAGSENFAGLKEHLLGGLGGVLVGAVVVAGALRWRSSQCATA